MYTSFLGISEALHMDIFRQPLRNWFFESLFVGTKLATFKSVGPQFYLYGGNAGLRKVISQKEFHCPQNAVSQFVIPAKSRAAGCEPGSKMI
jgi:hypothetical protein